MKYAIITVNHKEVDPQILPRRILIEYKTLTENDGVRVYTGVRVLKKDSYFTDKKPHSYHYTFGENSMTVERNDRDQTIEKQYKSFEPNSLWFGRDTLKKLYSPNEFECETDESAVLRFEIG